MSLIDVLDQIWTQILNVMAIFVTPDWGLLVSLLPVIVVAALVGPFLTGLMMGTVVYMAKRPRLKVAFEEGPKVAEIGPGGDPVFPVGLPTAGAMPSSTRRGPFVANAATTPWRSSARCAGSGARRSSTRARTAVWS